MLANLIAAFMGGHMSTGWGKTMGTALLAAFGIGAVGLGLALALNWLAGMSFSPWTNYISDLSVGAGGSSIVFIAMMVLLAVLTCWFFVGSAAALKMTYGSPGAVNVARVFGILGSIDIVVMVFFPLDPARQWY